MNDDVTLDPREASMRARLVDRLFGERTQVLVGRYELLSELGRGGLGTVHAAHDTELDRKVALKLISTEAAAHLGLEEMHRRLRREAQAMAKLSHPNVVSVYDVGRDGPHLFITMELVEGVTLKAWAAARPRRWAEIRDVLVHAGRGLAAAHAQGLVHRDFKPTNVLVDARDRAHVLDFGLARSWASGLETADVLSTAEELTATPDLTRTGTIMGTPRYMAPEQFQGGPVDHRTDQWAFCVTAHELLFGVPPFDGDDLVAIEAAVTGGVRVPVEARGVPAWVRRVIERGLSRDPEDRHASMDDLLAALQPERARPAGRALAMMGAGAIVALSLGGVAIALRGDRSDPAPSPPRPIEPAAGVDPPAPALAPSDPDAPRVTELHAAFTTPHQIRWRWTAEGDPDRLLHYELVTGPSPEAVRVRGPGTTRWTSAQNPELSRFLLPKTGDVEKVSGTTTDGHAPRTRVFAQLVVTDTAGHERTSNVAGALTQEPPTHEVVIFDDDVPEGFSIPEGFDLAHAAPHEGDAHLRYDVHCGASPECWVVLRRQGLSVPVPTDELTRGNYETTAYLELSLRITGSTPPWWTELWLWFTDDAHAAEADFPRIAIYTGFTARADGRYHTLEVPLRVFDRWKGRTLPYEELQANPLFMFGVSGSWTDGATVDVDSVRVRW